MKNREETLEEACNNWNHLSLKTIKNNYKVINARSELTDNCIVVTNDFKYNEVINIPTNIADAEAFKQALGVWKLKFIVV